MKKLSSHYSLIHNCTKPNNTTTNTPPLGHSQPSTVVAHDAATFTHSNSSSSLHSPTSSALSTVATTTNSTSVSSSNNDNSPTVIDKSILVNDPLHFYHQFKRMNAKHSNDISPTHLSAATTTSCATSSQQQVAFKKDDQQTPPPGATDSFRNILSVVTTSTSNIRSSTIVANTSSTAQPLSSGNSSSVSNVQQSTRSSSSSTPSHHQTVNNSKHHGEVNTSNGKKGSSSPTELSTDSVKQITSNTVLPRLPRIRIPSNTSSNGGGSNSNTPTNLMTPSSLSNSSSSSSNMMQDFADSPSSGCNLLSRDAPDNPSFINRRIFVGGLKETTSEQELIDFFSRSPNNYGPISHCVIMKKWDGRSRGFGFVTFSDESIAKKVLSYHKEHPFMIGNHRIDCQVAQSQGCKIDSVDIPTHASTISSSSRMVDDERLFTNNIHNSDTQSDMIYGASSTDLSRSGNSSSASSNNSPTIKKDTISSFDKKRRIFVGGLQPQVTKQAVHDYFSKHGTIEDLQLILNRRTPFAFITYTSEDSATKVLDDFHSGVLCKEFAAHDVRRAMPKGSFSFTKQREREMDMTRRVPPHRGMPPTETSTRQAPIPNSQPIVPSNNGSRKSGHTPPSYRYTPYDKSGTSRRGMQPYYDHSPTNGPMQPNGFFGPVDVPSSHISMYPTGHPLHHHHQPHIDERYMQPLPGQPMPSTSSFYPPPIPPYYDQPYMMMHHHHHQGMLNGRDPYMPREAGAYRHSDNISNSSGEMDDIRR
ncbi:predicted protein [Naegleria gruberi]|uniref:Predicted protein n=1 Tax=Naegleria gruberi TaxID=5762 RepID=D2VJW2_NAEGR|nr:uncharacterized protein NAEGRDRAFT_69182 [Naegleria gruberi]EFC42839.1 predicted protein [Naegleria gruberi]|eukprot:XP_002675583.1 predicted protein [Naegleria gruberi strain NEG-M]